MQKEISANNLKEAKGALERLGIPFCLFLGTALGAYRDHDFCPGDIDDIDIAIHKSSYIRFLEIIKAFEDIGFKFEHHFVMPDFIAPELSFTKEVDGHTYKIDIFFITPYKGKMAWRFYTVDFQGNFQTRMVDDFFQNFDKVEFYGEEYSIPGPIEKYLEENYGPNWRTPIHRDNWDWTKDNKLPYE